MLNIIRKPRKCPRCGGDVYKVLYGEPCRSEQEYFEQYGEHFIEGGCIIHPNNPDYECNDCELRFKILSFPKNAKSLAIDALINGREDSPFDGVKYCCIYRKQMVFEPTLKPGICYDGSDWVLVNQAGRVRILQGLAAQEISPAINKILHRFDHHDENYYRIAAMRLIKKEGEDCYYDSVRRCGTYKGKRAYQPVLKFIYSLNPPLIGLPLVILVDDQGHAEYIRDFLSFDIYEQLRRNKK